MSKTRVKNGSGIYMAQVVRYLNVLDILLKSRRVITVKEIVKKLEFKGDCESSEKQVKTVIDYISVDYEISEGFITPDGRPSKSLYYKLESGMKAYSKMLCGVVFPKNMGDEKLALILKFADVLSELDDIEAVKKRLNELTK